MKALVTGATGFTGSYMVKNLLEHGVDVKALVRNGSNIELIASQPVEIVFGDIEDKQSLVKAVQGVDIVYHIAALFRAANVPDSDYWKVNVAGTEYLLEASLAAGVKRFVHCSTCGVHGQIKNPPADENAPIDPEDIYQETKWEGEKLALQFGRDKGLSVTVVRPVGIYGPGDTRMLRMYKSVQKGKFIMFGGGDVLYHLSFVEDIVEGFRLAGENEKAIGETYIIAGENYTTLKQFAHDIAGELGVKPPRWRPPVWPLNIAAHICEKICVPLRIQPPIFPRRVHIFTHDRAFDISKAKRELGFAPSVDMKQGIHRTAAWYLEQGYLSERRSR